MLPQERPDLRDTGELPGPIAGLGRFRRSGKAQSPGLAGRRIGIRGIPPFVPGGDSRPEAAAFQTSDRGGRLRAKTPQVASARLDGPGQDCRDNLTGRGPQAQRGYRALLHSLRRQRGQAELEEGDLQVLERELQGPGREDKQEGQDTLRVSAGEGERAQRRDRRVFRDHERRDPEIAARDGRLPQV